MRKLKENPCSRCGKIGIFCKEMCQACYSKMQRNTPEGIERTKKYNETKQKEAQKRYRLKHKIVKPKKEKTLCECNNIAVVKGMCRNCYQASYIRKKYPNRKKYGINIKDKNFDEIYNKVLELVKNGFTIDKSLKITNIYRGTFYKKINLEQKKELIFYKELSKQIGYIKDDFLISSLI